MHSVTLTRKKGEKRSTYILQATETQDHIYSQDSFQIDVPHCNPHFVILNDAHYRFPTRGNTPSSGHPGAWGLSWWAEESPGSLKGSTQAQGYRAFTLKPCHSLCKDKNPSCLPCRDPCSPPCLGEGGFGSPPADALRKETTGALCSKGVWTGK